MSDKYFVSQSDPRVKLKRDKMTLCSIFSCPVDEPEAFDEDGNQTHPRQYELPWCVYNLGKLDISTEQGRMKATTFILESLAEANKYLDRVEGKT